MKIYHKFLLYQNKWIHPYVRMTVGVMTSITYLASILLIVGVVYEHGFTISEVEAHQLQRLYHGVWIVFLVDVSLRILLEYKDTRRTFSKLTWILTILLYLTLIPVIFHRPEEEGAILQFWEFLHGIPEAQNVEAMIASDRTCIDIKNEIVELENQLKVDAKIVDVSELQSEKRTLNEAVQGLYKRLANREQIGRAEKEIASLEEKRIANNQKLADLEKWEFTALQFQKDKDAELLKRINGMFRYVSFSFVNEQLNGGEKLTCVCTVNGTPFLDVNNAGQINAGIDIINAICTAKGVSAPIFVDNAESVNQIIPSLSQIIRLVVTTDKELTITRLPGDHKRYQ